MREQSRSSVGRPATRNASATSAKPLGREPGERAIRHRLARLSLSRSHAGDAGGSCGRGFRSAGSGAARCGSEDSAARSGMPRAAPSPSTAAGSSIPQCAVIGLPGQIGQVSPAALSQTVKMKSISRRVRRGELVPALRAKPVGRRSRARREFRAPSDAPRPWGSCRRRRRGSARAVPVQQRFREDRARGIAGAQEQDVVGPVAHCAAAGAQHWPGAAFGEAALASASNEGLSP